MQQIWNFQLSYYVNTSTFVYKSKKSDEEEHGVPKTQMVLFLVKTYKKLGSDWNIHL